MGGGETNSLESFITIKLNFQGWPDWSNYSWVRGQIFRSNLFAFISEHTHTNQDAIWPLVAMNIKTWRHLLKAQERQQRFCKWMATAISRSQIRVHLITLWRIINTLWDQTVSRAISAVIPQYIHRPNKQHRGQKRYVFNNIREN